MNPDNITKAKVLTKEFVKIQTKTKKCILAIAAPALYISDISKESKKSILIGSQNINAEKSGAYTGEISAVQAKSVGSRFTIVGHSERRELGETNLDTNKKIRSALRETLSIVLCVGETLRDSEGAYLDYIKKQIIEALSGVDEREIKKVKIAYEPVWAIGEKATGVATAAECLEISILIRRTISDLYSSKVSQNMTILYGGSANSTNFQTFLSGGGVQGFLLGRAGLDPKEIKKFCLLKK